MSFLGKTFVCLVCASITFDVAATSLMKKCTDFTESQLLYKGEEISKARQKAKRICELELEQSQLYSQKVAMDKLLKKVKEEEVANAETYLCALKGNEKLSFRRMVNNQRYDFGKRYRKTVFHEGYLILEEDEQFLSLYDNRSRFLMLDDSQVEYFVNFFVINKVTGKIRHTVVNLINSKQSMTVDGNCETLKNSEIDGNFEKLGYGDYK